MRVIAAALVVVFLAGPAFGQAQAPVPQYGEQDKEKTQQEKNAERDAERAYKRSLGNIPEQKAQDPWGSVRSDKPDAKAPAKDTKAAPKKTKTGTSAN